MRILTCILGLLGLLVLYGCQSETQEEIPILTLSTKSLSCDSRECVRIVTIESNCDWMIGGELPEWLKLDCKSGTAGTTVLTVMLSANDSDQERNFQIPFIYSGGSEILDVTQHSVAMLCFLPDQLDLSENDTMVSVEVKRNIGYFIYAAGNEKVEWVNIDGMLDGSNNMMAEEQNKNRIDIHVSDNLSGMPRNISIIINNKTYEVSDTLRISQLGGVKKYYYDGEWLQLQRATKGNVNLVFMGDGFTMSDLKINGRYKEIMTQAMENFFSIEPYVTYRDYFNVYAVMAESSTSSTGSGKTVFESTFGSGTAISCNDKTVFEYVEKIPELPDGNPCTVVIVLNSEKYAGTAYLYNNGDAISLCPMSKELPPNDFEGIIHHEAGGHGFGFLCDEYVYYQKTMPQSRINDIKERQKSGFYMNLDFTDNLSDVLWHDFIGVNGYENVGVYEGGYEYQFGVWRSEENSCMNNNIPYYNVQSRWCIVNRIMKLSGIEFSKNDFIYNDNPDSDEVLSRSIGVSSFKPLGKPIWKSR